jgi:hypothetical protein
MASVQPSFGYEAMRWPRIRGQNLLVVGLGPLPTSRRLGADHDEVAKDQGEARARYVGRSRGARARGRDDAAISGEAFNDARYRAAAAPFEETEREVLSGPFPHSTVTPFASTQGWPEPKRAETIIPSRASGRRAALEASPAQSSQVTPPRRNSERFRAP